MMSRLTDQEIIIQVRAGDTATFSVLVDRYKSMVFTVAIRMIKQREDAEEVAQDVFLSAYGALETFRGDSKISTWLYRIAYRKSLDHIKKKKRKIITEFADVSERFDIGAMDQQMNSLEQNERNQCVKAAIEELAGDDALLITLFYLKELSLKEIEQITGFSSNTVKVRIFRGRKRLLEILKRRLEPEIIKAYEGRTG
ncbi:MAG: sigma-70 family RNA polymerase sigma factor [Flavobacteriaceae bacterium]